ncbi:MAG: hypothetical protein PHF17_10275 [Arcobacteraceae bacterium]|jgi:Mg2+/citrate symporter|nr:hypothetical protein [Arcobacteraceae bacterium]
MNDKELDKELEEEIKKIEIKDIRGGRTPSMRINNFYSLMTILIMSVVLLWYVNYVLPEQERIKQEELKQQQYEAKMVEAYQKREAQIELSRKLHKDKKE